MYINQNSARTHNKIHVTMTGHSTEDLHPYIPTEGKHTLIFDRTLSTFILIFFIGAGKGVEYYIHYYLT